jgi:hypothetical protein
MSEEFKYQYQNEEVYTYIDPKAREKKGSKVWKPLLDSTLKRLLLKHDNESFVTTNKFKGEAKAETDVCIPMLKFDIDNATDDNISDLLTKAEENGYYVHKSGSKGYHCYIGIKPIYWKIEEYTARAYHSALTKLGNEILGDYIDSAACNMKRVLRVPFTVHPKTGKICGHDLGDVNHEDYFNKLYFTEYDENSRIRLKFIEYYNEELNNIKRVVKEDEQKYGNESYTGTNIKDIITDVLPDGESFCSPIREDKNHSCFFTDKNNAGYYDMGEHRFVHIKEVCKELGIDYQYDSNEVVQESKRSENAENQIGKVKDSSIVAGEKYENGLSFAPDDKESTKYEKLQFNLKYDGVDEDIIKKIINELTESNGDCLYSKYNLKRNNDKKIINEVLSMTDKITYDTYSEFYGLNSIKANYLVPFLQLINFRMHNNQLYKLNKETNIFNIESDLKLYLETEFGIYLDVREYDRLLGSFNTFIKKDYDWLGFNNGIYNINTGEFSTSSENPILPYLCLPHDYVKTSEPTPVFDKFIADCVKVELDRPINVIKGAYETIGLTLSPGNPFKLLFAIMGVPDSGKGTFANLLKDIVGKYNVGILYANDLGTKEEATAMGKHIAIINEIDSQTSKYSDNKEGVLKERSAGNDDVNIKALYQQQVTLEAIELYKMYLVGNHWMLDALSDAILTRMYHMPFNNPISLEDQDTEIRDKLAKEIPSIITKGLQAIQKIDKKPQLEFKFENWEIKKMMDKFVNPYALIFKEIRIIYSPDGNIDGESVTDLGYYKPTTAELNNIIENTAKEMKLQIKPYNNSYLKYIKDYFELGNNQINRRSLNDGNHEYKELWILAKDTLPKSEQQIIENSHQSREHKYGQQMLVNNYQLEDEDEQQLDENSNQSIEDDDEQQLFENSHQSMEDEIKQIEIIKQIIKDGNEQQLVESIFQSIEDEDERQLVESIHQSIQDGNGQMLETFFQSIEDEDEQQLDESSNQSLKHEYKLQKIYENRYKSLKHEYGQLYSRTTHKKFKY